MQHIVIRPVWSWLLMAAALACGVDAAAASAADGKAQKKSAAVGSVRFLPDSGETPKARSARLKRECKGRVNAGACAGYTR